MIDAVQFSIELANELNKGNFQCLHPDMAENATARAVSGVWCGKANMLADVYSLATNTQYSVKSYKDDTIKLYMDDLIEERKYTDFIIERRINGVYTPNGDPEQIYHDVLSDVYMNEKTSLEHYNVQQTCTVLLGYSESENHFNFRLTVVPFNYPTPVHYKVKEFTPNSKNYLKFEGNRASIVGYDEHMKVLYEWVHPNCQTFTRCLKKKYDLQNEESFYFSIEKQEYCRPTNLELMGMVRFG